RFDGVYSKATRQRIVKWQIPLGNTLRSEMNDTWGHYRDNRVQWLLGGSGGRKHLRAYRDAGVIALMFGGGADGTTCACDAAHDGVTNPAPINGNTLWSANSDDDGGYFLQKSKAYYSGGLIPLDGTAPPPTTTTTPTPTATPPAQHSFTTSATVGAASVQQGQPQAATVKVTGVSSEAALV